MVQCSVVHICDGQPMVGQLSKQDLQIGVSTAHQLRDSVTIPSLPLYKFNLCVRRTIEPAPVLHHIKTKKCAAQHLQHPTRITFKAHRAQGSQA